MPWSHNGRLEVKAADSTPGVAARRWSNCRKKLFRCAGAEYCVSGSETLAVITWAALKPTLICRTRIRLFIINPAPMSSVIASATSPITSRLRSRCFLKLPCAARAVFHHRHQIRLRRLPARSDPAQYRRRCCQPT